VWDYQVVTVPGLLQTEDYARAIFRGSRQITSKDAIDRHVAVRMGRQIRLIAEEPVQLWAILDESALLRPIGGAEVMRAQLRWLVERAALPNVTLQILPLSVGAHPGIDGAFTILDFADPVHPDIVFTEHRAGAVHLQKPADVRNCRLAFTHLRSEALAPGDSIAFIEEVMTRLWSWLGSRRYKVSTVDLGKATWRKSSRSGGGAGGNCVEIAFAGAVVAVRDSKDVSGPALVFDAGGWAGFLAGVKEGRLP
jgi:hypothetical protein